MRLVPVAGRLSREVSAKLFDGRRAQLSKLTNDEEYRFQTDPRDAAERPLLQGSILQDGGPLRADFSSSHPLDGRRGFETRGPGSRSAAPAQDGKKTETAKQCGRGLGDGRESDRVALEIDSWVGPCAGHVLDGPEG
jgi:hypothetical protein